MLTVLVATHNGAATLPRTLESFCVLEEPVGGWKLVIVDNASTDNTSSVIAGFVGKLPLSLIQTKDRGKNLALNLGLAAVDGDLVVFTDDDVILDPGWLVGLRNAADQRLDHDIFGGAIYPVWPCEPPEWITAQVNLGATYAVTPAANQSGPIPAASVWGANMAVRQSVFAAGHRFDEGVGPQAGQYIMGSEVEFGTRIEALGHRAWFVPEARVGHIIRRSQMEKQWVIRRQYRLGRHMFHQEAKNFDARSKTIAGAPRWKYRQLIEYSLKSVWCSICLDGKGKIAAELERSYLLGYLTEARNSTRG